MVKKFKTFDPQLVFAEQIAGSAVALTNEAKLSLYKKSQKSGIPTNVLETVYYRGYSIWNESFGQTPEQFAFDRVNSFIAGGFARDLDDDLLEDAKGYKSPTGGLTQKGRDHYNRTTGSNLKAPVTTPPSKLKKGSKAANRRKSFCARMSGVEGPMRKPNGEPTRKALALRKWNCEETEIQIDEKRGLWDNIHAKRERIKNGSGEHMRKPGSKGAPTDAALKASQNESADPCWTGYKQIGMKKKNGKSVPNCVPVKEEKNTLNTIKKIVREELDDSDSNRLKKFAKELKDKEVEIKVKTSLSTPPEEREPHPALELPTKFSDRKKLASKQTPTGVKKPDINGDIQREINSRLAPVLGGLKQKMDGKFRQNSISRMSEENISDD